VRDRSPPDFPRRRLLARCLEARPRVVRLISRPGWGKSSFARQIADAQGAYAHVDCLRANVLADFEAHLVAAFGECPGAVVVDAAERLAGIPGAVDRLRRAVEEEQPERFFVVASRVEMPLGAGRSIAPHEVLTLGASDLAFDAAEIRELFAGLALAEPLLERVIAVSAGWPVALFLFARLAREGRLPAALADLTHPALDDLYAYAGRETLVSWSPDERVGIAAAVAIPQATPQEIEDAVGLDARRALEAFTGRTGPVDLVDGRFVVPELPAAGVRYFLGDDLQRARDAALRNAAASSAFLRAAQIRAAAGDFAGAVDELEQLGRQAPSASSSPSYNALAKTLPPAALLRSRNVLVAVLADRETQAKPHALLAAVERFTGEVRRDSDPELVAGTRAALGALLRMADRRREARQVLQKALGLNDPSTERTALMKANLAAVLAVAGDLGKAEALLEEAGVPRDGLTLFPVERFEVEVVRDQLRGDAQRRRAAYARNADEARWSGTAALAHAMRYAALGAWLDGDDAAAAAAIGESNRLVDAALPLEHRRVRSQRPRLEAPIDRYDRWLCLWYMSAALLEDDAETARRFVQVALTGYAAIGVPYLDAIAALVAATVPEADDAAELAARARADAATIGEAALTDAVEAILAGRYDEAGILMPLARRIERSRGARAATLRIEVLSGRAFAGKDALSLRERELELLVILALERRSLTREALVARLWPDTTADEATAGLRTAVYRLRKQLRDPDAVISTSSGYRLHDTIHVDLLEAEQLVAGARRFESLSERERMRLGALLDLLAQGLPSVYARWEWFAPYEDRVRDLMHDVGIALAEDDLRRGDTAAAIARAEILLRADLLDEPATEIAIRAHLAAGRKGEALRRYRRYRDALNRDYGVAPGIDLNSLLEV
jgi:DNA-binding SARP family transcriptional activator